MDQALIHILFYKVFYLFDAQYVLTSHGHGVSASTTLWRNFSATAEKAVRIHVIFDYMNLNIIFF